MKQILYLLISGGLLAGCQGQGQRQAAKWEAKLQQPPHYRVIRIEGCEYLRFETTHGHGVMTHKGNCDNAIHCYRDTTQQSQKTAAAE